MTAAIEATLDDEIAVANDSTPSTRPRLPLIRVFFPITRLRLVDERLPAARAAAACGIKYSLVFLTSTDMPKVTCSAQSRLLRKASIPAPLAPPQIPRPETPQCDNQTAGAPDTVARTEQGPGNCNASGTPTDANTNSPAADASSQPATPAAHDNIHAFKRPDPAAPTPNLSAPSGCSPSPSSSSSSRTSTSRLPVRKSNSMPTAKSPDAVTSRRRATTTATAAAAAAAATTKTKNIATARISSSMSTQRKHQHQQQLAVPRSMTPLHRPASPRPSAVPVRTSKTPVNRTAPPSPVPKIIPRTREADVPMPRKATPTTATRANGVPKKKPTTDETDTTRKEGVEEEEEEAPVTRITAQERRRRENMRAQQIKMWRVREEREARDARTIARRKMMERPPIRSHGKELSSPPPTPPRRAVKFNLKRNKVIEISEQE